METYERPAICADCGGKCCKAYPGAMSPADVLRLSGSNDMAEALTETFATGDYVIDWWEGDPREGHTELDRGYYLRPRVKDDGRVFSPSWGGACTFLISGVGCRLSAEDRPETCRALEPVPNGKCIAHAGNKRAAALRWMPFYAIVKRQGERFEDTINAY